MKRLYIIAIIFLAFKSCEDDRYARIIKIQTSEVTIAGAYSAEIAFEFIDIGNTPITEFGLCWSTSDNPELTDGKIIIGTHPEVLNQKYTITGLLSGQSYYVRAYAITNQIPKYGNQLFFQTEETELPSVVTSSPANITSTSAELGGIVISDGNDLVIERGICYGIAPSPTIRDQYDPMGAGIGDYSSTVTGLSPGLKYFVRAYAKNYIGTAYGEEESFTTLSSN
ncbi:MAG: hypothetical protein WD578_11680 [Bacteroidales bacterium]